MALNRYMHPRNTYKVKKPDFAKLCELTPFFDSLKSDDDRFLIDFQSPLHLVALAKALLKIDFDLEVEFPPDRLIPTIPLRLNYILWVEDIFSFTPKHIKKNYPPVILDIGVGASCIYPLLGVRKNHWKFLGTEIDQRNFVYAKNNVESNCMNDHISLFRVTSTVPPLTAFFDKSNIIESSSEFPIPDFIDLVMVNPPFFANPAEAIGANTTRSERRKMPPSTASAARHESQTPGGEVYFVFKLAKDYIKYRNSVGIVTVMLGKQSSIKPVRKILKKLEITNISVYELCQGRVMRWGIAWTLNKSIKFPVSEFKLKKKLEKPPMCLVLSESIACTHGYSIDGLLDWLSSIFLHLNVLQQKNRSDIGGYHLLISAHQNTWIHNRRKRREIERQMRDSGLQDTQERSIEKARHIEPMEDQSTPPASPEANFAGQKRLLSHSNLDTSEKRHKCQLVTEEQVEEANAWLESQDDDRTLALEALAKASSENDPKIKNNHIFYSTSPILFANVFVERLSNKLAHGDLHLNGQNEEISSEDEEDKLDEGDLTADETPVRFVVKFYDLNNTINNSRDILHQLILYLRNKFI